MALTDADAAGAEADAVKRAELLDLCMTCWRQAQLLRRWPGITAMACAGVKIKRPKEL
jgi:hypothetical protein